MFPGQAIHKTQGAVATRSGHSSGVSVSKVRRHRGDMRHAREPVSQGKPMERLFSSRARTRNPISLRQCNIQLVGSADLQKLMLVAWLVVSSSLAVR